MKKNNIISLFFLLILIGIVIFFRKDISSVTKNPQLFRNFIKSYGNLAIPIYLMLSSIRSLFLLPAGVFAIASGITFGTFLGTILTCIGVTMSGIVAFLISRYAGRSFAIKLFGDRIETIENKIKNKGTLYIAALRMVPIFPFDAISYVSGLSNIKFMSFAFGTFIGSVPGAFVYTYLGNNIVDIHSKRFILSLCLVIIVSLIPLLYKYVFRRG
ncbi:MAG: TVP38/TMEM64 family protein [Caloramator sp.]|nr:TVP38/TMEM64 family protein [Caloramator sp.]